MNGRYEDRGRAQRMKRWPFWLADMVLVGAAITLAVSHGQPLSAMQMGWVVLAVGWGATLSVLPEVLDGLRRRHRASMDSQATEKLQKQLHRVEFRLAELEQKAGTFQAPDLSRHFQDLREKAATDQLEQADEKSAARPVAATPRPAIAALNASEEPGTAASTQGPVPAQDSGQDLPPELAAFLGESAPEEASQRSSVSPDKDAAKPVVTAAPPVRSSTVEAPAAQADTASALQDRLPPKTSVRELLRHAEAKRESNLPTSLDEIETAGSSSGMMKRALRRSGSVGASRSVNRLIQGGK